MRRMIAIAAVILGAMFSTKTALCAGAMLTGIENKSDADTIKLVLNISGQCEFSSFTLNNPARLVIDLKGADTTISKEPISFGDSLLSAARVGRPATDTVRVALDLAYLLPYKVEKAADSSSLVMTMARKVETKTSTTSSIRGVKYTAKTDMTPDGPIAAHIVDIDLNAAGFRMEVGIGNDMVGGREKLLAMTKRKGAAIGINGGYFNMSSGQPIDILIMNGKTLLLPDRYRAFFGFDKKGKPVFMRPSMGISARVAGELIFVNRLNQQPKKGELGIFTPEYGKTTGTDNSRREAIVRGGKIVEFGGGNSPIPGDGYVISLDGSGIGETLSFARPGSPAEIVISSFPDMKDIAYGFSAGPMLVKDGYPQSKFIEDFTIASGIIMERNPRTAVGKTKNNHLIFAVVEGRSARSIGMTLEELAEFMRSLGVVDAINLDGGGSSEIVMNGKIMNELAKGEERPLANAVLIYKK